MPKVILTGLIKVYAIGTALVDVSLSRLTADTAAMTIVAGLGNSPALRWSIWHASHVCLAGVLNNVAAMWTAKLYVVYVGRLDREELLAV